MTRSAAQTVWRTTTSASFRWRHVALSSWYSSSHVVPAVSALSIFFAVDNPAQFYRTMHSLYRLSNQPFVIWLLTTPQTRYICSYTKKGKVFPYSLPSVGPGADPGVQAADGLPTLVVTHQLQVERRTGKVRQSETDVLPLCHATNYLVIYAQYQHII